MILEVKAIIPHDVYEFKVEETKEGIILYADGKLINDEGWTNLTSYQRREIIIQIISMFSQANQFDRYLRYTDLWEKNLKASKPPYIFAEEDAAYVIGYPFLDFKNKHLI